MRQGHSRRVRLHHLAGLLALAVAAILAGPASSALAKDRNSDKIPDRWEKQHGLSLKVNQAHKDQDRDQLRNRAEFQAGDDPMDADSDDDGVADGQEGAGTIASFDASTGRLEISLFNGDTLTGTVNDSTEIECDNGDDQGDEDNDDQGDDNQGDDDGPNHREDSSGPGGGDDLNEGPGTDDDTEVDDEHGDCTTADLTQNTVVQEADLNASGAGAVFEEIELTK